ncbi:DUF4177 domain-containing protein [Fredinandcohnia sp. QZ13]|uniref:DUF4177 domain-containing protein n=1 Tax=Fredinandcohnia sp. QZ13 TaxID=3073144 RepID=UPI0028532FB1|nr:DUF4177 domain-containing protein [Fredinandcohnia sp. QZ13]MDR4887714.1 DUF4177 domain-containing protein [Fredinandcohnia sp. QZ13]
MYEYKFIKIELKGIIELKPEQDYHEIVHEHARDGWRLVQVLTPPTGPSGAATYFELIFEKLV